MSYILDALKKAESERERGLVPGVHAQSVSISRNPGSGHGVAKPMVWTVAAIAIAALLIAAIWWRWQASNAPAHTRASIQTAVPTSAATPLPATPPVAAPTPVAIAPPLTLPAATRAIPSQPALTPAPAQGSAMAGAVITPLPASTTESIVLRVPSPVQSQPSAANKPEPKPEPKSIRPASAEPVPARPSSSKSQIELAKSAASPDSRAATPGAPQTQDLINKLSELPADARLAVPKLLISGSTYSETPAYRMLIINGQVFHEGEKIATDMVLQQIRPNIAVLVYKGQRYSMPY